MLKIARINSEKNEGLTLRFVLLMFISTSDDITIFVFEVSVDSNQSITFIKNKKMILGFAQPTQKKPLPRITNVESAFATASPSIILVTLLHFMPQYMQQRFLPVCILFHFLDFVMSVVKK